MALSKRLVGLGFLSLIGITCLYYLALFTWGVVPPKSALSSQAKVEDAVVRFKVLPKSGVSKIASQLQEQGIEVPVLVFQIGARSLGVASSLKPGTYEFPANASLGSILLQMARGDRVREVVKLIPGMTIWQVRAAIDAHPALTHQTNSLSDAQLAKLLGLTQPSAEGWLFPDTYVFDPDDLDSSIYQRAYVGMQKQLANAWDLYLQGQPNDQVLKSPYQLLILASIIEKETGQASERGLISGVFHNRLRKGMMLQTDPTVIYGIGPRFDGNIRKTDLRRDTPYNTYMRYGLPPTPIAIPSKESLIAAAQPAPTNALYFVAKGNGSSHFSPSLKEHEAAVDRYQRLPAQSSTKSVK
ncbi:endolytic transglycosylase MltG [Polynucleobacter sp. HIN5]|uniref:endolytic transglycosylase MltG n=1 Tax=Polynucleobacter sp. HIN5 TaxID=3047864 RepID=UPI0025724D64|nr:endolytic transglycosylase MltG [Polynucleobacter sp. HIN5]BEI33575.1 endolytic transglycosylase MltG [Polynucleobacter sp. HIN5]